MGFILSVIQDNVSRRLFVASQRCASLPDQQGMHVHVQQLLLLTLLRVGAQPCLADYLVA